MNQNRDKSALGGIMRSYIRNTKYFNRTSFCSVVLLIGTLALLFFPLVNKTNNTEAIPVQSETTLTLSTSDINMTFAIDSTNGTFSSSDPANITVNTNNYTGYTLNIANTTNDDNYNKLINIGDNNYYLNSISSASTPEEFNAGNWGYLPSKLNGEANTKYQPAPNLDGSTLDTTSRANNEPNTYDIKLGIKADYSARAGTYTNSFTITAVANPVGYTITYNKNTEDEVTNMPAEQIGDVGASDVTIPNTTPERADYKFISWCNTTPTTTNGLDQCTGTNATTYQPGDTITLPQASNNNYDLYAMWKKVTIADLTYMQDFANLSATDLDSVKTSMVEDKAYELQDTRDGTIYHIAKLKDGRIWLLDNLALDLTNSTILNNMTPSNTNASTTSLTSLKSGNRSAGNQYATAGVSSDWAGSHSYSAPLINMDSKDVVPDNAPTDGKGNNKVGGYYNFCAASAGSYCYGDGTSEGTSVGNATEDICPAGWRMPIGGFATGEYAALANQIYGSTDSTSDATATANYRNALSLPFSGGFSNGSTVSQGSYGSFWSSTRRRIDELMYSLGVDTSNVHPSGVLERFAGLPVRCLVRNPDTIITYNANGGTGEMTKQTITDAQIVVGTNQLTANQLTANTFTRDGYVFTGWNTAADGSGTSYFNLDTYTYIGPSTTLYAQWSFDNFESTFAGAGKSKVIVGSNQYYKMQDMNTNICNTINTGISGQLVDIRDNTIYNVGKLPDGRCWLLDNLALDLTNSTVLNNMTPSNTNASTISLIALRSGNRSAGNQYATAGVSNWTSSYSYSIPLVNMASKDVIPNDAPQNGKGNNKVGGYYNFCAASAGSYCYGNDRRKVDAYGNATEDICPAGWRLPTGSTTGEYAALANQIYGSTDYTNDATAAANYRNALSLPLSGDFYNGSARDQGSLGRFWASTRYALVLTSYDMYSMSASTSTVNSSNHSGRGNNGCLVRCIAS